MPRQPHWFQYLDTALAELQHFPAPLLDRAALEQLLHLSRRGAIRLLHACGGYQAGKTFLIGREQLITALSRIRAGDPCQREHRRRLRLAAQLDATRRELHARRIQLPVPPDPPAEHPTGLPASIRLPRPGLLEVEFATPEDLLAQLFQLAKSARDDWDAFEGILACRR